MSHTESEIEVLSSRAQREQRDHCQGRTPREEDHNAAEVSAKGVSRVEYTVQ